jgi:hypothetical protein
LCGDDRFVGRRARRSAVWRVSAGRFGVGATGRAEVLSPATGEGVAAAKPAIDVAERCLLVSRQDGYTSILLTVVHKEDPFVMILDGNLLAWVEPRGAGEFVGAFIGEGAAADAHSRFPGRAPATQACSSLEEARQWVEDQAAALDLPVKWVRAAPRS